VSNTAPQPLYHEAYQELMRRIESGELVAGDRLPSERWLGESLGVSRTTVRRAVEQLITEGVVQEDAGAATIAGGPRHNSLMSLTEVADEKGLAVSARVLVSQVRPATFDEADTYNVAAGSDMFELRRLRLLDGLAVCVDHDVVPLRHLPDAPTLDFSAESYYAALDNAGHRLVKSRVQIEAWAATKEIAKLLELEVGAPVLVSTDHSSDGSGQLITIGRTIFRSDRHRFLATFTRTTRD
jgi:DNA-binding GntR family transcriptional regulator